MEYGAIDLHKRESQIQILTKTGELIDRRIATTRERLTHVFWGRPGMRILIEASTESEWVAQHLEEMGHEVIVADPNYGPMYGHRSRRIKTDRRDVAALREACQRGTYRLAHRRSARQHEVQCRLNVREELTRARTRTISLARSITRAAGLRIRSGNTETFLDRLTAVEMPSSMKTTLSPLRSVIEILNDELATADEAFAVLVAADPTVKRLTTLPGIGPITASAFVAALDVVSRFDRAGQVSSYLGLVPQEYSSGEKQRRGRVVRSAHPHLQSLLVQAAWRVGRASDRRTEAFRMWAQAIARRRGKKVAVVALARRLARA
jgi:transposase